MSAALVLVVLAACGGSSPAEVTPAVPTAVRLEGQTTVPDADSPGEQTAYPAPVEAVPEQQSAYPGQATAVPPEAPAAYPGVTTTP